METPFGSAEARAARELEADGERIEARLKEPLTPTMEFLLHGERAWVERQKRALDRVKVSCDAVLYARSTSQPVVVRDVTAKGAGIDVAEPPAVGDLVQLQIPSLRGRPRLAAFVRHASAETRRAGLEFVPGSAEAARVAHEIVRRFASDEDD